jgi:MFS family permease
MVTSYMQQLGRLSRDARLYLVSLSLVGLGWFGLYAVLFNIYLLRLGYGPEFVGLVNGVGFLANALFGLPAGALGSRYGCRRMMIVGMVLQVVTAIPIPFTHIMPVSLHLPWLLVTNSLAWLGGALYIVNGTPFLMNVTTPQERDQAFSVLTALFPLAGFVSSLGSGLLPGVLASILGLSLADAAPYGYPLLIASLLYALALLVLLPTQEHSVEPIVGTGPSEDRAPYALIAITALVILLQLTGEWGARVFFNVYLDTGLNTPTSLIGTILAVAQLVTVPAALTMPLLSRRLGRVRTITLATLGVACSLLPLAMIRHWMAGGLGFMGVIISASIMASAFMVFNQELVRTSWRAVTSGAVSTAMGLSSSATALGGGYIIAALGFRSLFLLCAVLTAAGALLFWAYFREPRGELVHATGLPEPGSGGNPQDV